MNNKTRTHMNNKTKRKEVEGRTYTNKSHDMVMPSSTTVAFGGD